MSNYRMERGWMDHPVFGEKSRRSFSEREAFLWLVENAAYKTIMVNICGKPFQLNRGQLSFSCRFMAEKWGWSINKYKGWLKKMETWGILTLKTDTAQTIITICNYSLYQDVGKKTDTAPDTAPDTPMDTAPDTKKKERIKERIKEKKDREPELFETWPKWIPIKEFSEYLEHRRSFKPAMTPRAVELAILALAKLDAQGHPPAEVLNQSIMNGWKGLFEIKGMNNANQPSRNSHQNQKRSNLDKTLDAVKIANSFDTAQDLLDAIGSGTSSGWQGQDFGGELGGQPQGLGAARQALPSKYSNLDEEGEYRHLDDDNA